MTSSPIYFEAYRDKPSYFSDRRYTGFSSAYERTTEGILRYDGASINMGGAMNYATGIFTAPQKGTFLFIFTGFAFQFDYTNGSIDIVLMVNNQPKGQTTLRVDKKHHQGDSATIQLIDDLDVGDKVYVIVLDITNATLYSSKRCFIKFTGLLIKGDVI